MLNTKKLHLNQQEKHTYKLHATYAAIEGVILGVLALNEFVFLKSLHGSNYQLGILFQFSVLVFLFLFFVNEFIKRSKNRKKLLRITAILTRLPLVLLLFFPRSAEVMEGDTVFHYLFLALFLIYFFGNIVIYPNINYLLKINYRHEIFSTLYSYSSTINKLVMLVVTFIYGFLLDTDNYIFVYVFPLIAILGILSVFILSKIKYPDSIINSTDGVIEVPKRFFNSVKESASGMISILKNNVPYRHFEIGFMFYGLAFMITSPIIYIYFYEKLDLNYSSVAFYRNSYNILAILILPFFGKLMGKIDLRKFGVITYSALGFYIFFLAITSAFPYYIDILNIRLYYTLICYIVFHGVFAATMVLLWNIGSAYFCKAEESGTYQSIHLFLTGTRGLFAPLLGILIYELFGFGITFGIAILSVLISIFIMIWSYRREMKLNLINAKQI